MITLDYGYIYQTYGKTKERISKDYEHPVLEKEAWRSLYEGLNLGWKRHSMFFD